MGVETLLWKRCWKVLVKGPPPPQRKWQWFSDSCWDCTTEGNGKLKVFMPWNPCDETAHSEMRYSAGRWDMQIRKLSVRYWEHHVGLLNQSRSQVDHAASLLGLGGIHQNFATEPGQSQRGSPGKILILRSALNLLQFTFAKFACFCFDFVNKWVWLLSACWRSQAARKAYIPGGILFIRD